MHANLAGSGRPGQLRNWIIVGVMGLVYCLQGSELCFPGPPAPPGTSPKLKKVALCLAAPSLERSEMLHLCMGIMEKKMATTINP